MKAVEDYKLQDIELQDVEDTLGYIAKAFELNLAFELFQKQKHLEISARFSKTILLIRMKKVAPLNKPFIRSAVPSLFHKKLIAEVLPLELALMKFFLE